MLKNRFQGKKSDRFIRPRSAERDTSIEKFKISEMNSKQIKLCSNHY